MLTFKQYNENVGRDNCRLLSPSERREVSEGLDTHGLAGSQPHDGGVPGLDELGVVLHRLTSTAVNLLLNLRKLEKMRSDQESKRFLKINENLRIFVQVYYR